MKIEDFPFDEVVNGNKIKLKNLVSKVVKIVFGGKLVEATDEQEDLITEIVNKFWSLDMVEEENISGFSIARSRFATKLKRMNESSAFFSTSHALHFKWVEDGEYQEFKIYSTGVPKSHL